MDVLKNLSQEEAQRNAKLSRFGIDNDVIFRTKDDVLESEGITFMFLQYLQDLGIVSGVEAIDISYAARFFCSDKLQQKLISHDRIVVVTHEDASKEVKFEVYLSHDAREAGSQARIL